MVNGASTSEQTRTDVHSELQETICSLEGSSKGPFTHIPPNSIPGLRSQPQPRKVLQGLPVCGGECPDTMTCPLLPERKKRAWSMRLPRSPDPVPSWNETQWCSGVFLVLATAGQPQWAHFRHPNHKAHLRKPNFNSGPWDKLLATRPEANVRQDKGWHPINQVENGRDPAVGNKAIKLVLTLGESERQG